MFELQGRYNSAKIFTDTVDNTTISQVLNLLNQESSHGSQIRIMPDCHAGAGCVIGTTITITDKVIPGLVGIDIGCGMLTIRLKERQIDLPALDAVIRKYVPAGGNIHESAKVKPGKGIVSCEDLRCYGKPGSKVSPLIFMNSIGTLGGGNHFIEIDKDDDDSLYLVIHTGSRRSGKDVAEYYQQAAFDRLNVSGRVYQEKVRQERDKMIAEMKRAGRARDIEKVLKTWTPDTVQPMDPVPYEFAYCEGDLFNDYISDMKIMQNYARLNRETIAQIILDNMGLHADDMFHTVHNYIDMESMILRKGSVSAKAGEILLIPMNMRDGSLLCVGKGNPDWNCSAPHGAGRLMSRSEAKASVDMEEFRKSMEGIYTTSVSKDTIDESPMAYKPMDEIVKNISDTAEIRTVIRPVYNFKAGRE